ncbi:LOW QUALITY PROTEIN: hypothetical protein ACHAXS_009808 [Conticribra weissflogii]
MLVGGSYLDFSLLYNMGRSTAYHIFHQIFDDKLVKISSSKYIQDKKQMEDVALQFARLSKGIICGCIGDIEGWIVKILRPTTKCDQQPSHILHLEGIFGMNVQAIIDQKKKILFQSILYRGSKHDSTAFKDSNFYEGLIMKLVWLADKGFYFIGDSAYGIKLVLLIPYDNVCIVSAEDNYNFFIPLQEYVSTPLKFSLKHNTCVIDACMQLYNFIIDFCKKNYIPTRLDELEKLVFDDDCH